MSEHSYAFDQFEGFAEFYDQFMLRLVNYSAWVSYILKIFDKYQVPVQTILDLACGTGIPSLLFARRGYQIIGVDRSQPMLEIFGQKITNPDYKIQLINSDIRNFAVPRKVDAAVCLYDSINYLLTEQDLHQCFQCVAQSLKPGGIFAFDMNTIYCLENFWDNRETPRKVGRIDSIWRNAYNPDTKTSRLTLTVFTDDGRAFQETHQERGYTQTEISNALNRAGFGDVDFYSHLTFLPTNDSTLRMMIVARLNAAQSVF
jgi:SAM-dependent methyltransferase